MNEVQIDSNQWGQLLNAVGQNGNAINAVQSAVQSQNVTVVSWLVNLQGGTVELLGVLMVTAGLVAFLVSYLVARR